MPPNSASLQTIKGLPDDKNVSFKVAKLWSSDDVNFLICVGFQISIANVSLPHFQVVQFGNKGNDSYTAQANDSRINTFHQGFSQMPTSNNTSLEATVMFDVIDEV